MTDASIRFQPRANIKTIEYAWQLVCAGIGAVLLPDWQEILAAEALVLMPVEDNRLIKDIGLAFYRNKENSFIISAVKEVCRSVRVS
jgi:hypothetical protein